MDIDGLLTERSPVGITLRRRKRQFIQNRIDCLGNIFMLHCVAFVSKSVNIIKLADSLSIRHTDVMISESM